MWSPNVRLFVPVLLRQLVPLKVHAPVHEAVQVLGDEAVVEGGVVDGVDHGRDDQLKN